MFTGLSVMVTFTCGTLDLIGVEMLKLYFSVLLSFSLFLSFFVSSVFILMDCAADSMPTYEFLSMR